MRISLLIFILCFFISCKTESELINSPKSEKYIKSFHEGLRYKLLENYDKALETFYKCLKEQPNDDASHFAIAQISLIQGNLEQAKIHTKQASELDDSNLYYQIELGYMYRELGEFEKSASVFNEIISKRSTNSNYYFECALSWELSGEVKKAIQILDLLEKNVGIRVEASLKKHLWYTKLMKMKEAEQELLNVLETQSNNQFVIGTLVDFYLNTEQYDKAMIQLKRLVEIDPKNGLGLFFLAQYEYDRKDIKKAQEYYSRAILSEKLQAKEAIEALSFLIHQKDSFSSHQILDKTLQLYSENDTIMLFVGDFFLENKEFNKAQSSFEKAVKSNPGSYALWEKLLYVLYDSEKWPDLAPKGAECLRTFPLKTLPYYMVSVALNQTGKFVLAQKFANEGLLTVSDDPIIKADLQGQVAEAYFGLKLFSKAKTEYLKAIETGKKNENDYLKFNLCLRLYENNTGLDLAITLIDEMITNYGTDFDLLLLKGDVYFRKERFNKALQIYRELEAMRTNEALVNERIGDAFARLNNIKEALFHWNIAAKNATGNEQLQKKIMNEAYFE